MPEHKNEETEMGGRWALYEQDVRTDHVVVWEIDDTALNDSERCDNGSPGPVSDQLSSSVSSRHRQCAGLVLWMMSSRVGESDWVMNSW